MKLFKSSKIIAQTSEVHGIGVFSAENISENELLEECHFYLLNERSIANIDKGIKDLLYLHPIKIVGNPWALVTGYGSLYNHSTTPNAKYIVDLKNHLYKYYSIKSISAGEEIFINYGN